MELRLALLGGVAPAVILGVCLVVGGLIGRRRASHPTNAEPSESLPPSPEGPHEPPVSPRMPLGPRPPRPVGWAWIIGALPAAALIHFATWSRPELWPHSVTFRFVHVAVALLLWATIEMVLPSRTPLWVRWSGRLLVVGTAVAMLLHPYLRVLSWTTVVTGSIVTPALVAISTASIVRSRERHHPALALSAVFIAASAAVPVLILGKTATAAQAGAGVAALTVATALASLITRRSTPTNAAAFVLPALLAWLLAVGCFATGKTNLASSILLLLAPVGWALPIPRLDLFWKRWSPGWVVGLAWSLVCAGSAVLIAVLTQDAPPPPYAP